MPTIRSEGFFARFEQQFRPFIEDLGIPETVFTHHDVEVTTAKYAELLETVGGYAQALETGEPVNLIGALNFLNE